MIPLFFLHKRKEAAVFWWREGRRTQMGRTTSKKMIPLLLLRKLYITEADFDKKAFERLYKLNII